jgi:hypothetical protein
MKQQGVIESMPANEWVGQDHCRLIRQMLSLISPPFFVPAKF